MNGEQNVKQRTVELHVVYKYRKKRKRTSRALLDLYYVYLYRYTKYVPISTLLQTHNIAAMAYDSVILAPTRQISNKNTRKRFFTMIEYQKPEFINISRKKKKSSV